MPTFASDIKPASTGLRLGNENQKWIAFIEDIFADTLLSNSPNAADLGFIRLSSPDFIAWRNAANTANVKLSKTIADSSTTPADTLVWSGPGLSTNLISPNLNPAATGQIRLASSDVFNFRNNANTADVNALSHNTDDTVTVGGSAGIKAASLILTSGGGLAVVEVKLITFSATPSFVSTSGLSIFRITLTADVTASTYSGGAGFVVMQITQDATGNRAFVWPATFNQPTDIGTTANQVTSQLFFYDGTNGWPLAPGVLNP